MIQGIIDIGSNTIRLAVYRLERNRVPELLLKKKHQVGLAGFIEENKMMPEGIAKACSVLQEYRILLEQFHIERVVAFATAALRNVENSNEAVQEIIAQTGISIRIISGAEEAELDFLGAVNGVSENCGLLVDVGGGSTELVAYNDMKKEKVASLPIGSLAMYKKHIKGILPTAEEIAAIRTETRAVIEQELDFAGDQYGFICGIGGTFKGAKLLHNAIWGCDEENCLIEVQHIAKIIKRLQCNRSDIPSDLLELLLQTVPERIKTVVPGLVIIDTLAAYFSSSQIMYSDSGVREGYIYRYIMPQLRLGEQIE